MKKIYLSLPHNVYGCITSTENILLDKQARILAHAYIPGLQFLTTKPRKIHFTIQHIESSKKQFSQKQSHILIQDLWHNQLPLDVYHLLYSIARVQLLQHNLFSIHASCIGKTVHYLLVGHTGVGKTSILLALIKEKMHVFSGNKTVVTLTPALTAIAGTKTITLRTQDHTISSTQISERITYGDRTAFFLNKNYYSNTPSVPIAAIILVRLNDGRQECQKITPFSALHKLYPYFLDVVNADTIICHGKNVFVGTPPPQVHTFLAKKLLNILHTIPTYSITGSLPFVTQHIKHLPNITPRKPNL